MAVRLQMKLGLVAESERLEDSPDTVAIVEPTIGATARSKGSLFLVVIGAGRGRRLREATHLVADTIQGEYYYDESAGLVVCLEKAIRAANRRLLAQRERLALGAGPTGPIGIGLAVVRGNELYVVTTGPVEAYLVRQAHLLTLPDAARANGLPMEEITPEVWRGEIAVRDSLVLVSSNLTAKLAPDELKDAVVTLHPQAAMEHLHHRFVAAGGTGSDAALALEAGEVSATTHRGRLVPVRPPEPRAGLPDRSPIPLADSVGGGLAAVSSRAGRARDTIRGGLAGVVDRVQDLLPRRGTRYRRVTPAASRRESQRRAAYAVLAFVGVVALLGLGLWVLGGSGATTQIPQITAGEQALATARDDVRFVFDNGTDLIAADPRRAEQLLKDAIAQVATAATAGIPASTLDPVRLRAAAGLDRLYGVVEVGAQTAFSFASQKPAFDLGGLVRGPDGAPYVLDRTTKTVYRISLQARKAVPIIKAGQAVASAGIKVGVPRYLAVGGPDLLVLDDKNILWRWRPADDTGKGTLRRLPVQESATWGNDIMAIGTFVANFNAALYNLYVMDPSQQQILRYTMLADGSSYPAAATGYLTTPQDITKVTSMYIDGEVYLADGGLVERFVGGRSGDWALATPGDDALRPTRRYTLLDSPDPRREGTLYVYDAANTRVMAFDKLTGAYLAQYRPAAGSPAWTDLRAFYVAPRSPGQAPAIFWIDGTTLGTATLQQVAGAAPDGSPGASPLPGGSAVPAASGSPSASPKATATKKPSGTPRPSPSQ
jgi:hypothetical protein